MTFNSAHIITMKSITLNIFYFARLAYLLFCQVLCRRCTIIYILLLTSRFLQRLALPITGLLVLAAIVLVLVSVQFCVKYSTELYIEKHRIVARTNKAVVRDRVVADLYHVINSKYFCYIIG